MQVLTLTNILGGQITDGKMAWIVVV